MFIRKIFRETKALENERQHMNSNAAKQIRISYISVVTMANGILIKTKLE